MTSASRGERAGASHAHFGRRGREPVATITTVGPLAKHGGRRGVDREPDLDAELEALGQLAAHQITKLATPRSRGGEAKAAAQARILLEDDHLVTAPRSRDRRLKPAGPAPTTTTLSAPSRKRTTALGAESASRPARGFSVHLNEQLRRTRPTHS